MRLGTRIFVDFWNFQLNWNDRTDKAPCDVAFERSPEKGIDAAIATDLLSLAWEGVLDVAVLVSGDSDFVPAVERIQEKGLKVVNATWRNHGHELAHACWASFDLDSVVGRLVRE